MGNAQVKLGGFADSSLLLESSQKPFFGYIYTLSI